MRCLLRRPNPAKHVRPPWRVQLHRRTVLAVTMADPAHDPSHRRSCRACGTAIALGPGLQALLHRLRVEARVALEQLLDTGKRLGGVAETTVVSHETVVRAMKSHHGHRPRWCAAGESIESGDGSNGGNLVGVAAAERRSEQRTIGEARDVVAGRVDAPRDGPVPVPCGATVTSPCLSAAFTNREWTMWIL